MLSAELGPECLGQLINEHHANEPPLVVVLILDALDDYGQHVLALVLQRHAVHDLYQVLCDFFQNCLFELFLVPFRLEKLLVNLLEQHFCEPLVAALGRHPFKWVRKVVLVTQLPEVLIAAAVPTELGIVTLAVADVAALGIRRRLGGVLLLQLLEPPLEVLVLRIGLLLLRVLALCVTHQVIYQTGHVAKEEHGMRLVYVRVYRLVAVVALDEAREKVLDGILHANGFGNHSDVLKELPLLRVGDEPWVLRPGAGELLDV